MASRFAKYALDYVEGAETYTFFFLAPPNQYDGIEVETGVMKIADDSALADMPVTKTGELTLSPVAIRKTLRVTINGRNKYVDIVINSIKAATVSGDLQDKTYKGGTIKRVLDPRKKTRY